MSNMNQEEKEQEELEFEKSCISDFIEATQLGTWQWNVQTGETRYNERWAEIIGYSLEELAPVSIQSWVEHTHPMDLDVSKRALDEVFTRNRVYYNAECRMRHRDGHWVWVHDTGKVVSWTEDGKPLWMLGTHTDITDRKQMEERLRISYDRLDNLTRQSMTVIWEVDSSGLYTYVSPLCMEVFGYTPDELEGKMYFYDLHPQNGRDIFRNTCLKYFSKHEAFYNFVNQLENKDGGIVWVSTNGMPVIHDDGSLLGYRGSDMDITFRKHMEYELESSEKNFRSVFETIDDLFFVGSQQGKTMYTNAAVKRKLGYSDEETRSMSILDFHPKEVRTEAEQIFTDMFEGKKDVCPLPLAKKDGSLLPVETRTWFGLWNGENCVFGISKDLSKEQEALQKFNKLFDNNPALMAVSTLTDRVFTDVNNEFLEILGFSRNEVIGKTTKELGLFCEPEKQLQIVDDVQRNGRTKSRELMVKAKDGRLLDGLFSAEIIESQGQKYFLTVMKDITEIKSAERILTARDELLSKLSLNVPGAIYQYLMRSDGSSCFLFVTNGIRDIYEVTPEEVQQDASFVYSRIHPDDYNRVMESIQYSFRHLTVWEEQYRVILPQKGLLWISGVARPEKHTNDSVLWYGYFWDISEIKMAEESLRDSEARYRDEKEQFKTTLFSVSDGIISTDSIGNIKVMNRIAEKLTGWSREQAGGEPVQKVLTLRNGATRESVYDPAWKAFITGLVVESDSQTILVSRGGKEIPVEISASPIMDGIGNTTGIVIVLRDVTEKREKQKQVEFLSFHDILTGLYNRRFFEEELKRLNQPRNHPLTLFMMDVNGLKLTNDAFGHTVGDELLKRVAEVLKRECRADEIISRIGGDEFVVIFPKTDEEQANRLLKRIKSSFSDETLHGIPMSVSCGSGTKVMLQFSVEETLKMAEDNMYRDKITERKSQRHESIRMIQKSLFEKIPREQEHCIRVSEICGQIGKALNLSQSEVNELMTTAILHDIGKIAVSNETLNKVGPLSNSEWMEIKRHPEVGYSILSSVNDYAALADIVLVHHERWDGSGYPKGIRGDSIPLQARIIAIADSYDAMTNERPYRDAMSKQEAIQELEKHAGTQFDPHIIRTFLTTMKQ